MDAIDVPRRGSHGKVDLLSGALSRVRAPGRYASLHMASIVLSTLNTRYSHAALGLRYLRANLGALRAASVIREFVVRTPVEAIVDALLAEQPRIVGFGV